MKAITYTFTKAKIYVQMDINNTSTEAKIYSSTNPRAANRSSFLSSR